MGMRTVQQYLKEADRTRLIDTYIIDHPPEYENPDLKQLSVSEIDTMLRNSLGRLIDRMCNLPVSYSDDDIGILFAHRCLSDESNPSGFQYPLVFLHEILSEGQDYHTYVYEFTKQEEIAGFLVSDNELTQRNIYGLLSDVLYQASWFGVEQEDLQHEAEKLEQSLEEAEGHDGIPFDEFKKEFEAEFGIKLDEESPDERELREIAVKAAYDYADYSERKEIRIMVERIKNDTEVISSH